MDPDPDADPGPSIFITDLQVANKNIIFKKSSSAYYFLKVLLHDFSKVKRKKVKSHKTVEIKVFLLFLSYDRRIKNTWIRWIRIRIRIRNTAKNTSGFLIINGPRSILSQNVPERGEVNDRTPPHDGQILDGCLAHLRAHHIR